MLGARSATAHVPSEGAEPEPECGGIIPVFRDARRSAASAEASRMSERSHSYFVSVIFPTHCSSLALSGIATGVGLKGIGLVTLSLK